MAGLASSEGWEWWGEIGVKGRRVLSGEMGLRLGIDTWLWLLTGLAACPSCSGEKGISSGLTGWSVVYPPLKRQRHLGELHRAIWMPDEPLEGILGRRDVIGEHREREVV